MLYNPDPYWQFPTIPFNPWPQPPLLPPCQPWPQAWNWPQLNTIPTIFQGPINSDEQEYFEDGAGI